MLGALFSLCFMMIRLAILMTVWTFRLTAMFILATVRLFAALTRR